MKKIFLVISFFVTLFCQAQLQGGMNKSYVDVVKGSGVFLEPADIWLDSAYNQSYNISRRYALVISAHGVGGQGADTLAPLSEGLMYNLNHGERPYVVRTPGDTVFFIVVAPQRSSYGPDPSWYQGIFESMTSRFRIDSNRVYLYGMSAGGWFALGSVVNNTDTTYNQFITAIWTSSAAQQDLINANLHLIADRNIPLMMDAGDQSSDASYYDADAYLAITTLRPLYSRSDTIVQRGWGHDHFSQRVSVTKTYPKLGGKNIYQWFVQYSNGHSGAPAFSGPACNPTPNSYTLATTALNEIYHPNGLGFSVIGGDTLKIPALAPGVEYSDIILQGFSGSSGCPIVITNSGSIPVRAAFVRMDHVSYFKFTGNGVAGIHYGFVLGDTTISTAFGAGLCDHYTVDSLDVGNRAELGFALKKNPVLGDASTQYPNYVIDSVVVRDNRVHRTHGEGMYIGHTYPTSDPYNSNLTPVRMNNVKIYNNTVDSTDWDGIQLSNARANAEIYNNIVTHFGLIDKGSQRAGIILGANTNGRVHDNIVNGGTGNGIQIFGYGYIEVDHNTLTNVGNTLDDGATPAGANGEQVFFTKSQANIESNPKQVIDIHDDIINGPKPRGILQTNNDALLSDTAKFRNNSICFNGSVPTTWLTSYISISQPISVVSGNTATVCNNLTPAVSAGSSQTITLPTNSVGLNGSAAGAGGNTISSYLWTQISGPSTATLSTTTALSTIASTLVAGSYVF
jgi:hypothetical protein